MALNYSELTRIKSEISSDLDELISLFNQFSTLIDENVDNPEIWQGASSADFKTKWTEFTDEKFPQYKSMFNKEIDNVMAAITSWGRSEGN